MDVLFEYNDILLANTPLKIQRFLYDVVNWEERMIAIKGPRGTGKTTMMLQRIKQTKKTNALYVTAEHPYFYNHTIYDVASQYYKMGGRYLFVDEVHKYPRWSRELKVIYDGFPELKIVFSASSALDIYKGEADLSRRTITYQLPGLSFREYLHFTKSISVDAIPFHDILKNHRQISFEITPGIDILPLFKAYLQTGYLPILIESSGKNYLVRLAQMINAVIDTDLAYVDGYSSGTSFKVKKLLGVLAESVPFKPNISAIGRKLDISRDSVYTYLKHLRDAHLLNFLIKDGKGISTLQKPDKLYLENTNLAYSLVAHPDIGSLRETFLLNQLMNAGLDVKAPEKGDFLVEGSVLLEIGGKNKGRKQVVHADESYVAADDIEHGFGSRIPLWLFGFLY